MGDIDLLAVGALAIGAAAFAAEIVRCRLLRAFGPTASAVGAWVRVIYQATMLLGVGLLLSDLVRYVQHNAALPVYFLFCGLGLALLFAIAAIVDRRAASRPGTSPSRQPSGPFRD